jgi:putative ABC transport system permease protein
MKLRHIAQESGQALRANLLRSSLTIIGIVVGIFAVTAMLALGEGLSQNVIGRISSFSQGDISIKGTLTLQDLAWVSEQPYAEAAIGTLSVSDADVIISGEDYNVTVSSVLGDFAAVQKFTVLKGEMFDFQDPNLQDKVLVATNDLETKIFEETGQSLLNQFVSVGGQRYEVVGILDIESAGFSRSDGTVYLPYRTTVGTLSNTSNFSTIGVSLKDSSFFEIAGKNVLEGLNASRYLTSDSDDLFTISTAQSMIESAQETTNMISLFLGIVGGIALFVGGIGTMNMMLTTVTERTKEIGLRKAIGARRRDILLQFLMESVFLTSIGGVLGITLTAMLAVFANKVLADSNVISVIVSSQVVLVATAVAIAVGVIFGLYPANNASKLQPVDALRAE